MTTRRVSAESVTNDMRLIVSPIGRADANNRVSP
jgi:hypothetical protein